MDTTLLIGVAGAALLLAAFAANAFKHLNEDSKLYHSLNFVGAALLTWYGFLLASWPFVVLEGIWSLVGLWHLVRLAVRGKNR